MPQSVQKTLQKNSACIVWHKGKWNEVKTPFSDVVELLKASVKRVQNFNPDLYDNITKGKKQLLDISLRKDEGRLAQCFVQESGNLEIFFEPNNIMNMLNTLRTNEDKISCLTYLVAHEMEHAHQGQLGDVLYTVGKNKGKPTIEQEIAIEADATAVGLVTAYKAGLTLSAKKVLQKWFEKLIPNLGVFLNSGKKSQEIEKEIFKKDLENRIFYYEEKGNTVESFSSELQAVVKHSDILKRTHTHSSVNVFQNLNHVY